MISTPCSDTYSLACQAQALACLLMLEQSSAPANLQIFDTTPALVSEFSELAFAGCDAESLSRLYRRYIPLVDKPTYQPAVFSAILAFCEAPAKRLEAACGPLSWARLKQDRSSPGHGRRYKNAILALLLNAADELKT